MRRVVLSVVLTIAIALVTSACASTASAPTPTVAPTATPTPVPCLAVDGLRNAEYQSEFTASRRARLTNGVYREQAAPGSASQVVVMLSEVMACGDLNADSRPDAAVVLISSGGGSGTFHHLAAVINRDGAPQHVASALMGDRVQVKSVSVESGVVAVGLVTHGPNDPLCCPTVPATWQYRLQGDRLVRVN